MNLGPWTVAWFRFALGLVALAAFGLAYLLSEGFRSEVDRAVTILGRADVAELRNYILSFGVWAPIASALMMILQALVAPLPAFVLSFANGLAFGTFWGGMLSLVSVSLAAAVAFGSHAFWVGVQSRLSSVGHIWGRRPVVPALGRVRAVLVARLVPIISFDIISYAAGLTRISFWRFMIATAVGMAPATFLYAYLGGRAPQYVQVLLVAFGAMIAGAVVAAVLRRRRQGKRVPLIETKEAIEESEEDSDE